jgi:hypothetical protein
VRGFVKEYDKLKGMEEHKILTKYLKDNGIEITKKERLPIYLSNTLDLSSYLISELLPNLLQEYENALKVKTEKT